VIRLDDVTKRYGDKVVLSHVNLHVARQRRVALIGPSGCGKSTLLRTAIGLVTPDSGAVVIAGERLTAQTAEAVRRRMGYVIQDGGLFPHLTARDNAAVVARHVGWAESRVAARLRELEGLVGFPPDLLARYPAELSGGQRQRVGIMRALMLDPDVLLMDEPLGALDPMLRTRLQTDLRTLFERLEKTVLLVTHDMAEAAYLADEIALMRAGSIVQRGPFAELAHEPAEAFVSEFIAAQRAPSLEAT
jgi:osmoprotectant transport system ATP-binding protein